uniref:Alternative protein IGF2BP1 n=1 Tax=Homo sapiens TaxID=9606 RepID=L8ECD2_HUMAN|nr:alternative protein IGF2BP1 [Homo sapiens]
MNFSRLCVTIMNKRPLSPFGVSLFSRILILVPKTRVNQKSFLP